MSVENPKCETCRWCHKVPATPVFHPLYHTPKEIQERIEFYKGCFNYFCRRYPVATETKPSLFCGEHSVFPQAVYIPTVFTEPHPTISCQHEWDDKGGGSYACKKCSCSYLITPQ